ncbi:MAG: methylamine utilization protein MauJ [Candidatus Acidiferrales bacterium]
MGNPPAAPTNHPKTGADDTPFLVYENGTPYFVPNSIYESATHVLELFKELRPEEAFKVLREKTTQISYSIQNVDLNRLWLKYFELYLREQGSDTPPLKPRIEMLEIMTQGPPAKAWGLLRNYLIQNVDLLSGWTSSFRRAMSERDQIFRGDDGLYYKYGDDGELCQVIGAKTLRETHLDFITAQVIHTYGNLRLPIEIFSWFAIGTDYQDCPSTYPTAMKAVLSEPKWQLIQHRWSLQHWDRSRTVKWRPNSNFCDPEWLVADLLGHLTDTLKIDAWQQRVTKRLENPTIFADQYDRQMDCVLDCHLRIGNEDEIQFEFDGRPYRWINGSLESDTILSVALRKNEDHVSVEEEVNRLLTLLGWEHRIAIARKAGSSIVGAKRPLPWVGAMRLATGLLVEPMWLFREDPKLISPRKWLAMSLFREALNSRSVFYEFLNYWKAVEVVYPIVAQRREWIDSNVDKLQFEGKRVAEIRKTQASVADYLYKDSRCAVAHVDHRPFVDPDRAEDYHRLASDAHILKSLASMAIESIP